MCYNLPPEIQSLYRMVQSTKNIVMTFPEDSEDSDNIIMRYEITGENWEVKSVEASEASEALKESGLTFVKEPKAYSEEEPEIESELDEVRERFEQINIETKKPVGKSVSQDVMVNEIKNLKMILNNCENIVADNKFRNEIHWIEDPEKRKRELSDIISFTTGGSLTMIYKNYRKLDFHKDLYKEKLDNGADLFLLITFFAETHEIAAM
ncbi:unnamed protein product [Rhizophagus irregularis]|nr:unnamed protein product [Rhizophagus irregularis]